MAHLLRGKQAGVQGDFSAGLGPEILGVDDIGRFGINSQISQLAYDPVQSLLALGTNDTKFGPGQIYVFGQCRVSAVFRLPRKSSVKILQFCADKLLCLDSKNDLNIFSLETKRLVKSFSPPGLVTTLYSDPTLDYVFLGTNNGEVVAYDLDRGNPAPFRLPNFWRERNPRSRASIVSLAIHPRDLGKLLIGYNEGAVIYTFKQNQPQKFFHYEIPAGAPGGDSDPHTMNRPRSPRLTHALWHPTGTFVLTAHEDSSLVFWDSKDGRRILARTISDTYVDRPGGGGSGGAMGMGSRSGGASAKEPYRRIAWCAKQDPDDNALLISGGSSAMMPAQGLTFLEFGRTPVYNTSSWQVLTGHLENPKRQRVLPTPPNTEVVDFCLIPRITPHFAGAHDPIAVIAILSSGEMTTLSFPSGFPITATNQLHVSMTFAHPFVTSLNMSPVDRTQWLGLKENRSQGPPLLKGGAEASRTLKRYEHRNIVQVAHADGTVRLWDAGHGDEIENESVIQADAALAVGRHNDVEVSKLSFSGATGELAVGLRSGELALFRWNKNPRPGEPGTTAPAENKVGELTNITERRDPAVLEGLLPLTLLAERNGPVTAVKVSEVGFVAVGFEGGMLVVIDLRGPAVIYRARMQDFHIASKRASFRKGNHQNPGDSSRGEWVTCLEFSVMTLEDEAYSSILLHAGSNLGRAATFKLLPEKGSGRYFVEFAGSTQLSDWIVHLAPLKADSGTPTYATQQSVADLKTGVKTNGVLLAVSHSEARLFRPASGNKAATKTWGETFLCDAASVSRYQDVGSVLVALCGGDGLARIFSLPGLRELGSTDVSRHLDPRTCERALLTSTGDILGWNGPAEVSLINIFGAGLNLNEAQAAKDTLWNPELAVIPPRPTISNMQWMSGTQYVTPQDMDLLVGGADRPPSKRMLEQSRADALAAAASSSSSSSATRDGAGGAAGGNEEGYWAYMQRQINERTEKLGVTGDNMERLGETSSGWAGDVSKFVQKQKRNVVMGAVKGRFGL